MLQLKTPLSPAESDLLLKCLSDMENDLRDRRTCSKQDLAKQTTIASAKQKVASHIYDSFYRDEITHMVFALDSLTRKYREQLTGKHSAGTGRNRRSRTPHGRHRSL